MRVPADVSRLLVASATAVGLLFGPSTAAAVRAQEPAPPPASGNTTAEGVAAIVAALEQLADEAARGDWQAADEAYNRALDAVDAHRPELETALGDPARSALARVNELLGGAIAGLDAENAAAVQAAVARAVAEMAGLGPGVRASASAEADLALIDWQARIDAIVALGDAGAWRDMRNGAIDLTAAVTRVGPVVARAVGGEAARQVDVVRVFAMRLRIDALDQSIADARTAAGIASQAVAVLASPADERAAAAVPTPRSGVIVRAYEVQGGPGDIVVVPVVLEGVPQIGLGATSIELGWDPGALRLADVSWDVGAGTMVRDDAAGRVVLTLPPAPVGPSGKVMLARLRYEIAGGRIDARAYLPTTEIEAMESAVSVAREFVRTGDMPKASAALATVYATFVGGRGRAGSLYDDLDAEGSAAPLSSSLLTALDLVTQPAETDRITIALRELEARMAATWSAHLASLRGSEGIPIAVRVVGMTDTSGAELPVLEQVPGLVVLPRGVLSIGSGGPVAGAAPTVSASTSPDVPAAPTDVLGSLRAPVSTEIAGTAVAASPTPSAAGAAGASVGAPPAGQADARGLPAGVIAALLLAAVAGVAVAAWPERGRTPEG